MKLKEPFSVFSNLVFFIPLYFALLNNSYIQAIIIASVCVFSIIFHLIKPLGSIRKKDIKNLSNFQKLLMWLDVIMAYFLVLLNMFIFWQRGFPIEFWCAILISIVAVFIYFAPKKNYDFSHGIWHLLSGIIVLLAV